MNFENPWLNIQTDTTVKIMFRHHGFGDDQHEKFESIIEDIRFEIATFAKVVGADYATVNCPNQNNISVTISFKGGRSDKMINQTIAQMSIIIGRFDGRVMTSTEVAAKQIARQIKKANQEAQNIAIERNAAHTPAVATPPAKKKRVVKHPTEGMTPRQITAWKKKMAERLVAARAVKAINDAKRKAEKERALKSIKGKKN